MRTLKAKQSRRLPSPTTDPSPRVTILGFKYYIDWARLRVGSSVFLKTTATAEQVMEALREPAGYLWPTLKAHERCEFGYYGVRVWRLS